MTALFTWLRTKSIPLSIVSLARRVCRAKVHKTRQFRDATLELASENAAAEVEELGW